MVVTLILWLRRLHGLSRLRDGLRRYGLIHTRCTRRALSTLFGFFKLPHSLYYLVRCFFSSGSGKINVDSDAPRQQCTRQRQQACVKKRILHIPLLNDGFGFYLGDPLQTVHQLPPIHFAIIAYHRNGRDSAALDDEIAMRQRLRLYPAHVANPVA
jgi:hypothetical protein